MKDFRSLKVWDKAHQLSLTVYNDTKCFPESERYGITSQLRRACISIPTNIAEGCGRNSEPELARFFEIAMGSASETEYLLLLSRDLGIMNESKYMPNCSDILEIKKMLSSLIVKIRLPLTADR